MCPIMVLGSCLVREEQCEEITGISSDSPLLRRNTGQDNVLLRLLWEILMKLSLGLWSWAIDKKIERHGLNDDIIRIIKKQRKILNS